MEILGEKSSLEESALPATASQSLFRELFEHSPDGIVVTNSAGRIIEANPRCEELFGFSRLELLGLSIEALIPERYRPAHPQYREKYFHAPRMRPMGAGLQLYGLHRNGSEFPVDILLSPVNAEGLPLTIAVIRDISTRIRTEEALRLSEERLRLLVEGARDYAIFMLDPAGRIASWNPGAERIKGYRAEEILGQHFSIFYPREDLERNKPEHELAAALAEGRHEDEGWRIRKDGARFWANVIICPLYNSSHELIGFSKITRDLTERRRAEDALLLELSTSVLSGLDIQQMMRAIAASVQRVAPNDWASIALYDDARKSLRPYALTAAHDEEARGPDIPLVAEDSPEAWVFQTHETLFLANIEACSFPRPSLAPLRAAGIRTGWWLPLNCNGTVIGTLLIGSRQLTAFEHLNRNTLLQLAAQIALTIDSAHATRQLSALASRLREEKRYLEEELRTEYSFEEIVGHSTSLKRVLKQVETVSPTDASVLILGETGTGKELIARAIHNLSPRASHTFVKVNCSSIPTGLLESELFGHEKGAFTGAIAQRVGRLELAHQGTLFLDEIGDLPLELQPKLLRALQEKEIERLGGKRIIPVDFRLLAATHRDLARMVKEGDFRSDLYYRLKVFPILIPPLRQRSEDISELVNYFVTKHARRMNKRIEVIPEQLMSALARWHWPGNIRELENFLERAVILSSGPELRAPLAELQDLDEIVGPANSPPADSTLEARERDHILQVLRKAKGVIGGPGGAAEQLGLKRTTLNSKMKKLGIERRDYA